MSNKYFSITDVGVFFNKEASKFIKQRCYNFLTDVVKKRREGFAQIKHFNIDELKENLVDENKPNKATTRQIERGKVLSKLVLESIEDFELYVGKLAI